MDLLWVEPSSTGEKLCIKHAWHLYEEMFDENIGELSPLELLKLFSASRFGIDVEIGGEKKRFVSQFTLRSPNGWAKWFTTVSPRGRFPAGVMVGATIIAGPSESEIKIAILVAYDKPGYDEWIRRHNGRRSPIDMAFRSNGQFTFNIDLHDSIPNWTTDGQLRNLGLRPLHNGSIEIWKEERGRLVLEIGLLDMSYIQLTCQLSETPPRVVMLRWEGDRMDLLLDGTVVDRATIAPIIES